MSGPFARLLGVALAAAGCAAPAPPPPTAPGRAVPVAPVRLGTGRWQGSEAVTALAVSPNGAWVAVGDAAGTVTLRDGRDGSVAEILEDHARAVSALAFSPDGTLLASVAMDGRVLVRRLADGSVLTESASGETGSYSFGCLAFRPDGSALLVGGVDAGLRCIEVAPGGGAASWDLATWGVCAVEFSADGALAVAGGGDGSVKVLDGATGRIVRTHRDPKPDWTPWPRGVAFVGSGGAVLAVRRDGLVGRWSADGSGGQVSEDPSTTFSLGRLSPAGDRMAVAAGDGTLRWLDAGTGEERRRDGVARRALLALAFTADGGRVAVAGEDGAVRLLDTGTGGVVAGPDGHLGPVYAVAASADGTRVATGGRDGTARLWDAATGREIATLCACPGPVYAVAFSADGREIAAGGWDGLLRRFDAATGAPLGEPERLGREIRALAAAADGAVVAADRPPAPGDPASAVPGLRAALPGGVEVLAVALSADGRVAWAALTDGTVVGQPTATLAAAAGTGSR